MRCFWGCCWPRQRCLCRQCFVLELNAWYCSATDTSLSESVSWNRSPPFPPVDLPPLGTCITISKRIRTLTIAMLWIIDNPVQHFVSSVYVSSAATTPAALLGFPTAGRDTSARTLRLRWAAREWKCASFVLRCRRSSLFSPPLVHREGEGE